MGFFAKAISWFITSPQLSGVRADAVKAITEAGKNFLSTTQKHAPDMVGQVEQHITNATMAAVAGALTKGK